MRLPDPLVALLDEGIVQEVIRPLLSGKEAEVYLVVAESQGRVAKVYKEAEQRSFKNRAAYTEGRRVRSSRDMRAMQRRSRHGKARDEAAWRSTEVDMIYRLRQAGVRVPEPYLFVDGVLIMEMVQTATGQPAPRLGELTFSADEAVALFDGLLGEVVRMLCAGVVHGDLSVFNVLQGATGPVIIDLPQAVEAASNPNAHRLLRRDVQNLRDFVERFAPGRRRGQWAEELWEIYQRGELRPTTQLSGKALSTSRRTRPGDVVDSIREARADARVEAERRQGGPPRRRK